LIGGAVVGGRRKIVAARKDSAAKGGQTGASPPRSAPSATCFGLPCRSEVSAASTVEQANRPKPPTAPRHSTAGGHSLNPRFPPNASRPANGLNKRRAWHYSCTWKPVARLNAGHQTAGELRGIGQALGEKYRK
jgi:hypothetical protein